MADDIEDKAQNPRNSRPPARPGAKRPQKSAMSKSEAMDTSGLGRVVVRNEFYRDGYRLALRVAVIQCFVIFGLIGAMFFIIYVHQPENRYFATTEDGRLIPMVPLTQPNLSTPALLSWVAQAASETMSFSFSNYRRNLQEASRNFTRSGWESFSAALQQARIIESIEANTQELSAVPRGAPILKSEGIVAGQYQWVVQIPMILSFVSGSKSRAENWLVTIVIVRVPRLESPNGVGIAQWIAVPG
ncbi:MAG: type IV secretion protein IcmL [Micavibrio aeruginosavorus]|uniref:Type IV secretion protein IcmL n=1 Tax=Micavibrio aeruginosavorus TaxID=349221 RepID=A0A2W5QCH4_9BACT|nr:MAG: type IV secretion protein IcmL [Micavibrio aeruginosavorus]